MEKRANQTKLVDGSQPNYIMENGVPKAIYWQGEGKHLFHPMQAGRWLFNHPSFENYQNFLKIAKKSKNGGYLWYYPNEYKLLRMVGREVTSCISNAEFLTAFNKLYDLGLIPKKELINVFLSFSSEEINYKDALIELPLANNYPEIVLNGWLHAIIRIIDFYEKTGIGKELIDKTLKKLSEMLVQFDDEENKISKYSNLSPYQIKLSNCKNAKVYYDEDNIFNLVNYKGSIYECCVKKKSESSWICYLGIPYEVSPRIYNDQPFSIELHTGTYLPSQTTPGISGSLIKIESIEVKGKHMAKIDNSRLFTGYPTPFTKNGVNFYHVFHVAALGEIVKSFDSEHNPIFEKYYKKWMNYIDNRNFSKLDLVEKNINKCRYR